MIVRIEGKTRTHQTRRIALHPYLFCIAWIFFFLSVSCFGILMAIKEGIRFNARAQAELRLSVSALKARGSEPVFNDDGVVEGMRPAPTARWMRISPFGVRVDPDRRSLCIFSFWTIGLALMSILFFLLEFAVERVSF